MKHLLVSIVLLFSSSMALAQAPALMGSWKSARPLVVANGMTVFLGMSFNEDSTGDISSICSFSNKVLEATVRVPMEVTDTTIEVLASAKADVKEGGYNCEVSVEPTGVGTYVVRGNQLRMTFQGQSIDFVRR